MIIEVPEPKIERVEKEGIDYRLLRKRGSARSFRGFLLGKIKIARDEANFEMAKILETIYKEYEKYQVEAKLYLKSWKGKSSLKIIEKPDSFEIVTFQKPSQDEKPEEMRREIFREDVNFVIRAINMSKEENNVTNSVLVAENYCRIAGMSKNNKGNFLIYPDGHFEYQHFFSDRNLHTTLNLILRLLNHYNLILYRGKKIRVLKEVADIQTILK